MATANAPLRLGMITVEPHGRPWAEVLALRSDVRMVSAWDYDPEHAKWYADHYGIPVVVDDPRDMLGQVDAVLIGGGRRRPGENGIWGEEPDDHLELATPFLEAGIPTLIDKPFADKIEDAVTMYHMAREHRTLLMTCSAMRYDASILALRQMVDDGGLGTILGAVCMIGTGAATMKWYIIHMLEAVYVAFGPGIESVFAVPSHLPLQVSKPELARAYSLVFRWRDGRLVTMFMACDYTDAAETKEQEGRAPRILWPTATVVPPYLPLNYSIRVYGDMNWADMRPVGKGCYGRKVEAFVKMVRSGVEPFPLEHAIEITEALVAAEQSLVSGKLEMLRPTEEILAH